MASDIPIEAASFPSSPFLAFHMGKDANTFFFVEFTLFCIDAKSHHGHRLPFVFDERCVNERR